jgi:hypothetical protein
MINISNLASLYVNLSTNLTKFMIFHFDLSWRAIKWFPYVFVAGTLASGIHIRLEIELN